MQRGLVQVEELLFHFRSLLAASHKYFVIPLKAAVGWHYLQHQMGTRAFLPMQIRSVLGFLMVIPTEGSV